VGFVGEILDAPGATEVCVQAGMKARGADR
jgi:hypothetical protein